MRERVPGSDRSGILFAAALGLLIAAAIVGSVIARRAWWLPVIASRHGGATDGLFIATFIIISIAFVLVQGVLALFAWRYRAEAQERASYWHDHRLLEAAYTIIPAIVLVGLTLVAAGLWSRLHSAPPADALVVEVRAEQFGWRARYPGADQKLGRIDPAQFHPRENPLALDRRDAAGRDDVVINASVPTEALHLVVDRAAQVILRSKDVLHSFFIPAFRVKQDVVPGMALTLWFVPTRTGRFEIACAELCGVGHYAMRGFVVVQTQAEFDAWLAQQARTPGRTLAGR